MMDLWMSIPLNSWSMDTCRGAEWKSLLPKLFKGVPDLWCLSIIGLRCLFVVDWKFHLCGFRWISIIFATNSGWWFQPLLKNISQLGLLCPICGKIKNVPNHQPDSLLAIFSIFLRFTHINLPKTHQNSPVLTPFLITSWHHFSTSPLLAPCYLCLPLQSYPQVHVCHWKSLFVPPFSHGFFTQKIAHLAAAGTLPAKETWVPFQTSERSDSLRMLAKIKKPRWFFWGLNML